MRKQSKVLKFALFIAVATISINIFCLPTYAQEEQSIVNDSVLKYNGTVDELPKNICEAYYANPKAESLDVYDENLYSITTNNTDGTKTLEIFQTPIKYIEDNEIKFIDTTIEEVDAFSRLVSDKYYECTKTPVKAHFSQKISDGISVEKDNFSVKCYPKEEKNIDLTKLFDKPILGRNNTLTYENVFSESDKVIYTPVSTGVKEEIVLEEYTGTNVFEFVVELENLEPLCLKGDSIPLIDVETKEQTASISQIDVKDSSSQPKTSLYNSLELEKVKDNVYTLKLIVDEAFLTDEATIYPVVIDPTITFNADPIYDAPVFSGFPNTNFNSNTYNVVGYHGSNYGEGIAFVKLNNLQNYKYINQINITGAYLKVYEGSGKTNAAVVYLYNCMQTWNNTTVTYNTMPTIHTEPYSARLVTSSGWYNFDITALLRGWMRYTVQDAGGKSQEYGVALKMSETGVSSKSFASANNTSYPPSVIINYTEDTSLSGGEYFIRSQHSGLMADADTTGNVRQYSHTGLANQTWRVTSLGNGYYKLQSKQYNTKSMSVTSNNPGNGTNVNLSPTSTENITVFRLIRNVDKTYRILSVCGTQNVGLAVNGASTQSNANIQTWDYSGEPQQRWIFYKAYSNGPFSYWNSDSGMISHMNIPGDGKVKIYVDKTAGFGKSVEKIKEYVDYGMDAWGFQYIFTNSSDDCNIHIKGITRGEANELGFTREDAVGVTTNIGYSGTISALDGIVYVKDHQWKTVYSLDKKTVYLIWDTTQTDGVKTSNYSNQEWEVITTHELGHAMGYEGHPTSIGIMLAKFDQAIYFEQFVPSDTEKAHLMQVY